MPVFPGDQRKGAVGLHGLRRRFGDADAVVMPVDASGRPHLFVYGTLQPGDVRWHLLSPYVVDEGWADSVTGRLYDTGLGYPAAVFGGPGTVVGRTYPLLTGSLERCLAVLDDEEDTVDGLYRRVTVATDRGVAAWAYEYGGGLTLTPIRSGVWTRR